MNSKTFTKVMEEAIRLYEVPGGKEILIRRIRTPLTETEIQQGLKDGRIDPVMYRTERRSKRDKNGTRMYDITYDDESGEEAVEIKRGKEYIRLSMKELNREFDELRHQNIS